VFVGAQLAACKTSLISSLEMGLLLNWSEVSRDIVPTGNELPSDRHRSHQLGRTERDLSKN
jgi:hypothetical protein